MHEYRLADLNRPAWKKRSLRLDDWVLCRLYNRKFSTEQLPPEQKESFNDIVLENIDVKEMKDQPTSNSIRHGGIEQSIPFFDHFIELGTFYSAIPPDVSPMNSSVCFQNLDLFQNSSTHFSGSTLQAPVQNTTFNPISSSIDHQQTNYNWTGLMSGLNDDSGCSKPSSFSEPIWQKKEVESSFILRNFWQ